MKASQSANVADEAEPAIPYADESTLSEESRALLQRAANMIGVVPNAGRTYLHRPDILKMIDLMNYTIVRSDQSNLDIGLKNKLGVICSSINNCVYCTSHQCNLLQKKADETGEKWGLSDDEVLSLISGADKGQNDIERLCFEFARTASQSATDVSVDLLERMKEHMSSAQIVELGSVVAMWKFFNTMHDSLHIPSEGAFSRYSGFIEAGREQYNQANSSSGPNE